MNAKDKAINLCGWMEVGAEPAGSLGCFWRVQGPRRICRETAESDIATMRRGIEQAIDRAREKLPIPTKADLERRFFPILSHVIGTQDPFHSYKPSDSSVREAAGPVVDEIVRLLQEINS